MRSPGDARRRRALQAPGCSRVRPLSLPEREGPSGECGYFRLARLLFHPADERLSQRRPQERRTAEGEYERDDQIAKALTPDEIKESAEYFGAMKWTPWIKVVEANTVPKMQSRGGIWTPLERNQTEPM